MSWTGTIPTIPSNSNATVQLWASSGYEVTLAASHTMYTILLLRDTRSIFSAFTDQWRHYSDVVSVGVKHVCLRRFRAPFTYVLTLTVNGQLHFVSPQTVSNVNSGTTQATFIFNDNVCCHYVLRHSFQLQTLSP